MTLRLRVDIRRFVSATVLDVAVPISRGVTIRYPRDTIRIAIRGSRYDTYRDTCSNLHTIRNAIHGS